MILFTWRRQRAPNGAEIPVNSGDDSLSSRRAATSRTSPNHLNFNENKDFTNSCGEPIFPSMFLLMVISFYCGEAVPPPGD